MGRGWAAHDIADATLRELDIDILVVGEPNRTIIKKPGWFSDTREDIAVYIRNKNTGIFSMSKKEGYVIIHYEEFSVYCCYISPNIHINEYRDYVNKLMYDVRGLAKEVVVIGDINSKSPEWGSPIRDNRGDYWTEWLAELNMVVNNTGDTPTFVRDGSISYIDVTCSSQKIAKKITNWQVLEGEVMTYHQYILFEIINERKCIQTRENKKPVFYQDKYTKELREKIPEILYAPWSEVMEIIAEAVRASSERLQLGNNRRAPYWWNQEINDKRTECTKIKRKLTRIRKKSREIRNVWEELKNDHKELRRELKRLINKSKKEHWEKLCRELDEDIWGEGYKIVSKCTRPTSLPYNLGVEQRKQIAEALFPECEVRRNRQRTTIIDFPQFVMDELKEAGNKMKTGKAPGPDGIPPEAIKICVREIPEILLRVTNELLQLQQFPDEWKVARLVLIWKPGKPIEDATSFRPLCMLNVICKLYESMIKTRIEKELEEKNGISKYQYGFRKGRSTIDAVKWVVDRTKESKSKWVALILIDIKNAFNTANWDKILTAMEEKKISEYLINIISSYLNNRSINIAKGEHMQISQGVPQGSVLGPTLWNILYDGILNLELGENVRAIAYADDLGLYVEAKDQPSLVNRVNVALSKICTWIELQELNIAEQKTEAIILRGQRKRDSITFKIKGTIVRPSKQVKYLGITLDQQLTFREHVKKTVQKAEKQTAILTRLMPNVGGPGSYKRQALYGVTLSILLYGGPVWQDVLKYKKYKGMMERVQRKMLLRVASAYRTASTRAIQVITGATPIEIMVKERLYLYESRQGHLKEIRIAARNRTLEDWQEMWDANRETAQWTKRLIPNIKPWVECRHRRTDYFTTQFFTGHGSFRTYAKRMGKSTEDTCIYCGDLDTPEHTMFYCQRWERDRNKITMEINTELNVDNLVITMLKDKMTYDKTFEYIRNVMMTKEKDRRQPT